MIGKRFQIFGKVQGVGFRWSTQRVAQQLEVTGWCRNLPDGSVEVCAYGDETQVGQLFAWLQRGPRSARVSRVESYLLDGQAPVKFNVR